MTVKAPCASGITAILLGGLGMLFAGSESASGPASAEVTHGPSHSHQVALVFEMSQGTEGVSQVLDVLRRFGIPATFFVTGRWADEHPRLTRAIAAEGHAIGNGAWSRKNLNQLPAWQVKREVLQADDRFESQFPRNYVPLFRPPCGDVNPRVRMLINRLGFAVVRCTIDSLDSLEAPSDASIVERNILQHRDHELDGASILLHANVPQIARVLSTVVTSLWSRGFQFVSLQEWVDPSIKPSEPPVLSSATDLPE